MSIEKFYEIENILYFSRLSQFNYSSNKGFDSESTHLTLELRLLDNTSQPNRIMSIEATGVDDLKLDNDGSFQTAPVCLAVKDVRELQYDKLNYYFYDMEQDRTMSFYCYDFSFEIENCD